MLNRRHIRIKVMQSIYALMQSGNDDLVREEKFLNYSLNKSYDLYVLLLDLLLEIRNLAERRLEIAKKKYLPTKEDKNPNTAFIDNRFLQNLKNNRSLQVYIKEQKLGNWREDNEYVNLLWKEIQESKLFEQYTKNDQGRHTFSTDVDFISKIFSEIIAVNDKLYDYIESQNISWLDDLPFVNTWLIKHIRKIDSDTVFSKAELYKDKDDMEFAKELFKKVALHQAEFTGDIDEKTPNWDTDRIAEIDLILIKMALTEFIYFPSIPTRVTINEYIEIAKDYSTEKSSFFVNGVLDKLLKDYTAADRIKKSGRGLL
ncbi:MAG: transcription antitermination factor NusB [Flavobacteriaceae bacterium]|nr:transcription antitermination factor NusB [Flavobacteriaceae bacterium]